MKKMRTLWEKPVVNRPVFSQVLFLVGFWRLCFKLIVRLRNYREPTPGEVDALLVNLYGRAPTNAERNSFLDDWRKDFRS